MMRDFADWALETARMRGATYADARVMDIRHRDLSTKNGQVGMLAESESIGIGIRVLAQGSWGFASTDRLTREGIAACAAKAVAIAKASALAKRHDVRMVPVEAFQDTWQNPYVKDPFRVPLARHFAIGGQQQCQLALERNAEWILDVRILPSVLKRLDRNHPNIVALGERR